MGMESELQKTSSGRRLHQQYWGHGSQQAEALEIPKQTRRKSWTARITRQRPKDKSYVDQ